MPQLLWDASALSKRYFLEVGSDTVDALFGLGASVPKATTYLCYAETCASLRRRFNSGAFDFASLTAARSLLRNEVLVDPDFLLMTITDEAILTGVALTDRHNLNSSDAAMLATYLRYARAQPPAAPRCVLVAADQRLLRAAAAEGVAVLNSELLPAGDVPAFLAAL